MSPTGRNHIMEPGPFEEDPESVLVGGAVAAAAGEDGGVGVGDAAGAATCTAALPSAQPGSPTGYTRQASPVTVLVPTAASGGVTVPVRVNVRVAPLLAGSTRSRLGTPDNLSEVQSAVATRTEQVRPMALNQLGRAGSMAE